MAILTRFISNSSTPEAISNARIDPAVASQTATANAQASDQFFSTLTGAANRLTETDIQLEAQNRVETIQEQRQAEARTANFLKAQEHVRKQQEAEMRHQAMEVQKQQREEAKWYGADVASRLSVDMFQTMRQAKAEVKPGGDILTPVLSQFDNTAKEALKNAPSDEARLHLAKGFIGYRSRVAQQAAVLQNDLNDQHLLNKFEGSSKELSAIVQDQPEQLASTMKLLSDQANALKERGVPAAKVESAFKKQADALHMITGLSYADKNPEEVLQELQQGSFNDLGAHTVAAMKQRATAIIDKQSKETKQELEGTVKQLVAGLPVDKDINDLNDRARKYGLDRDAQMVNFYTQLSQSSRGLTLAGLEQQKFDAVSKLSNTPSVTPDDLKTVNKFYDQRIKLARDDPFAYAANQGIIPDGTNIPRISPGDDPNDPEVINKIKQLKVYGEEVQRHLGLGSPVVPFTKGTFEEFHQKLIGQSPEEQIRSLTVLNGFDTSTMYKAAETIAPKNPALGMAIGMRANEQGAAVTPELQKRQRDISDEIIKGTPILAAGALGQNKTSGGATVAATARADVSTTNTELLGGLFENDPSVVGGFEKAARAVSAFRTMNGKDRADYRSALEDVSGVVHLGQTFRSGDDYKTIPPIRGWGTEEMEDFVDKLDETDKWSKYGNGVPHYANGNPLDLSKTPAYKFQFIPIDSHRYVVQQNVSGQRVSVKNQMGEPFVINLFKAANELSK